MKVGDDGGGASRRCVEGDGVDVNHEGEERVATLLRVRFQSVPGVDAATFPDPYVQNGKRQADKPNSEIGKRTRYCCSGPESCRC